MSREQKMSIIRECVPRLRELLVGLSVEEVTSPYDVPEWTIAQNIHHLIDTHINTYLRFKLILTEDHPTLPRIDGELFADLSDAKDEHIDDSLLILEGLHRRWIRMMGSIEDWGRTGYYDKLDRVMSLDDMLDYYSEHCNMHYRQIQGVMAKMPVQ